MQTKKLEKMVSKTPSKNYLVFTSIIVCFSIIMRFRGLDTESFWLDELTTLSAISKGTWRGAMEGWLSMVGMGTWLMYYWKLVVGDSDFALRSLSAISGVLLIIIITEFTRRFHDERAAIITGSMLSISHLAILYSQEFRPYMFTTTFIWFSFLLIRVERKLSKIETIICVVLLSFSYLVHYVAGLVIVLGLVGDFILRVGKFKQDEWSIEKNNLENCIIFLRSKGGQCLKICFGVAMLAFFMLEKMKYDSTNTNHSMWINDLPERPVVSLFDYFFGFDTRGSLTDIAEVMWYFVLLTPVLMFLHKKLVRNRKWLEQPEWFVWIVGGGTMLVIVLYSLNVRNLWVSRYFVFSMPAWYILFGIGISKTIDLVQFRLKNKDGGDNERVAFFVAVLFSFFFVLNSTHWYVNEYEYYEQGGRSDFKGMSYWLDENIEYNQEGVFIISQPYSKYWDLYLDRMGSHVEIDEHSSWGDISTSQVIQIIDDEPFEVIHVRGHKMSMWGYESLTLVISPDYELVESIDFIEGKIDVYHRTKNGGLA
ncbi:MAG: hypothetical protein CMB64_01305 [Euryarchaeota archaeon]|nr:hypothetical protein [Euryarchaeota archaeon]